MNELVKQNKHLPQKSAAKRALLNPLTLIPLGGGVSLFITALVQESFIFGFFGVMLFSSAWTLFVIMAIVFKISMVLKIRKSNLEEHTEVRRLKKKLKSFSDVKASKQAVHINESFVHFKNRLKERVGADAAEYDQYLTPAQEMYDAAIRNLKAITRLHQDISLVHMKETKKTIARLKRSGTALASEIEIHQRKIDVARESQLKITELKKEVDKAITTLIEVSSQLNDIVMDREEVQKSAEVAMAKFNKAADLNRRINEKVKSAWNMMK